MNGKRFLATGLALLCVACTPARQGGSTPEPAALPAADPASMTYRSNWLPSGQVTLTHGVYRMPAAPGSAAELVIRLNGQPLFGFIGGREVGAVVLVTQAGGTGSFYDLALIVRTADGWSNTDVVPLGDRVTVHDLFLRDDRLVAKMVTHGPLDPLCCPTRSVERRFEMQGDKLAAAGETALPPPPGIVGPVWRWVQTLYNNDTRTVPPRSEIYTVQFGIDGTVDIRADCNRKGGNYLLGERQIAIEITRSTMAACPEGSLEEPFVRDLTGAVVWFLKDDELYIDIKYDTGTMRLQK